MRERHTFIHPDRAAVDPKQLKIDTNGLSGPSLFSVREERYTLTLAELPSEVQAVLDDFEELSIRWASGITYETLEPFSSRLAPGLHLSYAPRNEHSFDPKKSCWWIRKFDQTIDCHSLDAFVKHQKSQETKKSSLYLYHKLEHLHHFVEVSRRDICDERDTVCHQHHTDLYTAYQVDLSYDDQAKSLKMSAFWPLGEHNIHARHSTKRRVEVGILGRDSPPQLQAHEVGISGTLAVLGQSKEPSPALFSFPSRHRQAPARFTSTFLQPTGLHPTLRLNISSSQPPASPLECNAYAYLTLPKVIFADRYQLADELFLASKNLGGLQYITLPVDLEAPAYTTEPWGSSLLLRLAPPKARKDEAWSADIPLHLRYAEPSSMGEFQTDIPAPVVFWACHVGESLSAATNPFDRTSLGYDGLFDTTTSFWHVTPGPEVGDRLYNPITIPVLKEGAIPYMGVGTAAAVGLGFLWVIWTILNSAVKAGKPAPQGKGGDKRETKKTK